jgi:hypothetical protein
VIIIDAKMVQENFIEVDGNKIRYLEAGHSKNTGVEPFPTLKKIIIL